MNPTDPFDGILLVDKPSDHTSHDVVARIRGRFKLLRGATPISPRPSADQSPERIRLMTQQATAMSKMAQLSYTRTTGSVSLLCRTINRLSAVIAMNKGSVIRLRCLLF